MSISLIILFVIIVIFLIVFIYLEPLFMKHKVKNDNEYGSARFSTESEIKHNFKKENINHIIRTLRSFLEGFSLLINNNAFGNPLSIKESFELSLEIIINGIKSLEGVK